MVFGVFSGMDFHLKFGFSKIVSFELPSRR